MPKLRTTLAICALLTLSTGTAFAQPPINGIWKTANGDFQEGRSATSWATQTGRLASGNVLNIDSYNGGTTPLGSQWSMSCMQMVSAVLIADLTSSGTGSKIYLITYVGGVFELDGAGPWGGGASLYSGLVDTYNETRTIQFVNGAITGANSNHSATGHLPGFSSECISLSLGNGVLIGDTDPNLVPVTDTNVKPTDYPDFLDSACSPVPVYGRWGNVTDITLTITGCLVPTRETTWGGVKKLYEE